MGPQGSREVLNQCHVLHLLGLGLFVLVVLLMIKLFFCSPSHKEEDPNED